MPVSGQELELLARERAGAHGSGEGEGMGFVDLVLEGTREEEIGVNILHAGLVEGEVGFADSEGVGREEFLAGELGWDVEGGRES